MLVMRFRKFGRLGWNVSEVGYGTWGLGGGPSGWQGGDDTESISALHRAIELGCNFFDTAWIYGRGHSEKLVGAATRLIGGNRLYTATKVPPRNLAWPASPNDRAEEVFPYEHIVQYAENSLRNLGCERIDLLQFHVWQDAWCKNDEWKRAIEDLKQKGMIEGVGISVNTWEPSNVLLTLETGLIDSVQVIYNLFEQQPEDALFPYCEKHAIAVIARVPFDEGALTGAISLDSRFDPSDWRASYFVRANLEQCVPRVDELRLDLGDSMPLPELALRFVLDSSAVSTVIPGMRRRKHVETNLAISDHSRLSHDLVLLARRHRWNRTPTSWSQ
jgi:aryl-alcohol dehydrogenase-like predicted oxidoreductase